MGIFFGGPFLGLGEINLIFAYSFDAASRAGEEEVNASIKT